MTNVEKLSMESKDLLTENQKNIADLFPNALVETEEGKKIDFDILKQELSKDIVEGNRERYHLDFPGKKEAIVEANRKTTKTLRPLKEKSVDFDNTKNIYIEGDNLEALKILQESYLGKIKCIYIDPPYNTGNDFVYNDKFSRSTKEEMIADGRMDENGNILISKDINNDSNGRYHSDWLKMMYPRIKVARNMLADDGIIFISIDDSELSNVIKICEEIFGEKNKIGCVARVAKTTSFKGNYFAPSKDYVVAFAKNIVNVKHFSDDIEQSQFSKIEKEGLRKGEYYRDDIAFYLSTLDITRGSYSQRYWIECPDGSKVIPPGKTFPPQKGVAGDGVWRWTPETFEKKKDLIVFKETTRSPLLDENGKKSKWNLYTKSYLNDREDGNVPRDYWDKFLNRNGSEDLKELNIPFDYAKPTQLIEYILKISGINKQDIVLDFFSGSATTANAVMKMNSIDDMSRQFIMVQIPEIINDLNKAKEKGFNTICDIGEERIRRAGKKIKEENPLITKDLDIGFRVYKVDDSNMKDIYYTPDKIEQKSILDMVSNVKEDRTAEDLLTQVILNLGLPLDLHIEEKKIGKNKAFYVEKNSLIACFDDKVDISILDEISKVSPLKICLRESSFIKDQDKINFFERLKKLSPDTETTII